ncbi:MAG: FAD-dependent thymidylate synthase [Clostridia bacterium]|nr:FAD-dependent thymidylate synthase [Clostridia bacterium]
MEYKSGVYVLGYSNCGEKMCAAGGRISTQPGNALGIWEKSQDDEKNANLIDKVTRSGHNSTVEHMMFNLAFNDVSVIVEQFMIEFRLASFTVKSRRYVDFYDAGFYVPEFKNEENKTKYIAHISSLFEAYKKMTDAGIPKEDARFVLPYCFFSNFFCSLGGRELLHVLHAMLHGRGSKSPEIYTLGQQLLEQVKEIAPGVLTGFEERKPKKSDELDLSFIEADRTSSPNELVEYISGSKDAAKTVATAAMLEANVYSASTVKSAVATKETRENIIKAVINSSRPRALESVQFTFALNKVSLSTLTHFARHRIHSIQIPSLSTVDRNDWVNPDSITADKEMLATYTACFKNSIALYEELKADGETDVLPYIILSGNTLSIVSTMNGRELLLFMKLRSCTRAQWEIQIYANKMLEILRSEEPELFRYYGPSCYVDGYCPEGRLTCGRAAEMKEKYSI